MMGWLHRLDASSRKAAVEAAASASGITAKAIEKDWWVTLGIYVLFQTRYVEYLTFKGGTSLSKGFGLIDRFSEDIDIALDAAAFGFGYMDHPSKNHVERMRRAGSNFTRTDLLGELNTAFVQMQVPDDLYALEAEQLREDMPDTDPQVIYLNYKSLFEVNAYVADRIKFEVSVRSRRAPWEYREISSLLHRHFPAAVYGEETFSVRTLKPQTTFIEKILLLHEEYNRADHSKMRIQRMSRHYYDVYRIFSSGLAGDVLQNRSFLEEIMAYRKAYSRLRHFDYDSMTLGNISMIPEPSLLQALNKDYEQMAREMMYGEIPEFSEIIRVTKEIETTINLSGS
jgi:hypothetical protein